MAAPVIGITLDYEESGGFSVMPWYAVRENYCRAVSQFGAIPLPLPHEVELVEQYLGMIDGLMVTGGAFDVSPALYGDTSQHETVQLKERRTQFEWGMTKGALAQNKAILGICGGQQLLNVVLGGTLIQHIPDSIENCLEHEQPNPRNEPGHSVAVAKDTLLHRIVKSNEIQVNSAHHQSVDKTAPNCIVNGVAPDGVIEGIEHTSHRYCLGVQWHPEYQVSPADDLILKSFVEAASAS